ncbi:MAG: PASTA domain-containing protein [bacterium]|nr:PASTA domain-containing protein [bacterium]
MDEHGKKVNIGFFKKPGAAVKDSADSIKKLNVFEQGHRYGLALIMLALISVVLGVIIAYIVMPMMMGKSNELSVPDITGLTIKKARTELEVRGLDLRIAGEEYSEKISSGLVISQNPLPFTNIKFYKVVEVIVSLGSEKIQIPKVYGLHISNAIDALTRAGFTVNDTNFDFCEDLDENIVMGTEPPFNSFIPKGSTVTVNVSRGKKNNYVFVGKYVNMSADSAVSLAKSLKLVPFIYDSVKASILRSAVIAQYPDSGEYVKKQDTIKFKIQVPE